MSDKIEDFHEVTSQMSCQSESVESLKIKLKSLKLQHDKQETFKKLCCTQTADGFQQEIKVWRAVCVDVLMQLFEKQKSLNPELTMMDFMDNAASETARELLGLVGINCEYASIESSVSLPEAVAMLQSNVFSKQNHTPSDSSLCVDTILRSCLDGDVAEQCKGEIETLAKAVQYYVQHTIAQNETAARCEKEKRLHLENQLKDAFNILDHVRAEIEETKERHLELVSHVKAQRAQLKQDRTRLSTELANMNNEVARLHLMREQIDEIEANIHALNENCKHSRHSDHSQVRHLSARMLPNSDRSDLERELSVSKDVLSQQGANIATLSRSINGIKEGVTATNMNDGVEQIQVVEYRHGVCQTHSEPLLSTISTGNIADASSTDIHLLNAIHSIHSLFAGNENKVSTSKGGMAKIQEHFQRRVAGRLFQFEQKCIAELNSKMNKHIETLSTVLNGFTQNCLANPQK